MPVYRYKLAGVGLLDLSQKVPGSPTIGSIGPSTYVDITVASGSKADLDDYMALRGFTYISTDPTTTPAAQAESDAQSTHDALRSLIHFIEDGPAAQFASGAYCETLPVGNSFPTSCIWWTSSGKTAKIVEEDVTWNTNKTINTDVWKMYAADGSTVLVTVTDTYDYTSGNFLTPKRTRTIA